MLQKTIRISVLVVIILLLTFFANAQTTKRSLNNEQWKFYFVKNNFWFNATVPGTIHTDLLNNKLIPDPFTDNNESELQWIENEDWQYQTNFKINADELNQEHIELQFDGLDTYANVFLNDSLILNADNMFRCWDINVKNKLRLGENKIKIVFLSAVKKGKDAAKQLKYALPENERIFTRKAQYQYGWDFAPRYVSCGIWKDVKLVFWNEVKINDVSHQIELLTDSIAKLKFNFNIQSDISKSFVLSIRCKDADGIVKRNTQSIELKKGNNNFPFNFTISNPKRWWCNGLGEAHLYDFSFTLRAEKVICDSTSLNIGLRTIELMQETDSIGKSFYFKLNGFPVFMKGANYIPPDVFIPRVRKIDYEKLVTMAAFANINMLRVWGGGVYPDNAFFDACDKKGILVWQDFMFACAMYPGDDAFIENVKQEIKEQIIRLRNHPSLALWCGNNEIDEGWKNWGWQKQFKYSTNDSINIWRDYENLFQKLIPQIVAEFDINHQYWPSSPSIGWGRKESVLQGDSHYWGVWWGMEPFDVYKKKVGRFMTEYGFQGMPSMNVSRNNGSLYHYNKLFGDPRTGIAIYPTIDVVNNQTKENEIDDLDSIIFLAHQKHPTGFKTINEYMARDFIVPNDFQHYTYVSQLLQARGMKTAIEAHRRAKPTCMGTLFWQLNDCWPGITWSSIDFLNQPKALYYQAKRSFENVIVSITEGKNEIKVIVVNDGLKEIKGKIKIRLLDFDGYEYWAESKEITIDANGTFQYFTPKLKEEAYIKYDFKKIVLTAAFEYSEQKEKSSATFYFLKPKYLKLSRSEISIKQLSIDTFELNSKKLAKDVCIELNNGCASDNYFDLLPDEKKIIKINNYSLEPEIISVKSFINY